MKTAPANKIDRDGLHEFLWKKANSRGRVTVKHLELADDLGIRGDHLGRIMAEMCKAGRMDRMAVGRDGVTYVVRDPVVWRKTLPRSRR